MSKNFVFPHEQKVQDVLYIATKDRITYRLELAYRNEAKTEYYYISCSSTRDEPCDVPSFGDAPLRVEPKGFHVLRPAKEMFEEYSWDVRDEDIFTAGCRLQIWDVPELPHKSGVVTAVWYNEELVSGITLKQAKDYLKRSSRWAKIGLSLAALSPIGFLSNQDTGFMTLVAVGLVAATFLIDACRLRSRFNWALD